MKRVRITSIDPFKRDRTSRGEELYGPPPEGVSRKDWKRAIINRLIDMDRRVTPGMPFPLTSITG